MIFCFKLTYLFLAFGCEKGADRQATTPTGLINQYTLTYTAGDHGSIDGTAVQKIKHGGTGTPVTAIPAEGYHFVNWSDGVTTEKRNEKNVTGDLTVEANFAINQYSLNYIAEENGNIEGPSNQTVKHGGSGSTVERVSAHP